jgi:hypothetical protein
VVNITGNTVASITSLSSPTGASINGVGGWSVLANTPSANAVQITHPLGVPLTDFSSLGINGSNVVTRSFTATSTAGYAVIQNSTYTTASIYSISNANAAFASTGTGDFYIVYFRAGQ